MTDGLVLLVAWVALALLLALLLFFTLRGGPGSTR